jgi:ribose 5-phosphate isomerase B
MVHSMATIAIGADHAGFALKQALKGWLVTHGYDVTDHGTHSTDSVDYPDFAAAVARDVSDGRAQRGLLVCGSGIGMAIAANKIAGVRAAVAGDPAIARVSREHNDTNVLALGARLTAPELAAEIVQAWLDAAFEGGRHARRVDKLGRLDDARKEQVIDAAAR